MAQARVQRDLVHNWCNAVDGSYEHRLGNLSARGNNLYYAGVRVARHIRLHEDHVVTMRAVGFPTAGRTTSRWIGWQINRGCSKSNVVIVPAYVLYDGLGKSLTRLTDEQLVRLIIGRLLVDWPVYIQTEKIAKARGNQYILMQDRNNMGESRADTIVALRHALIPHPSSCFHELWGELLIAERCLRVPTYSALELATSKTRSENFQATHNHGNFGRRKYRNYSAPKVETPEEIAARKAKDEADYNQWVIDWHEGRKNTDQRPIHSLGFAHNPMLRLKGGRVQTSWGVEMGLRMAYQVLQLANRFWDAYAEKIAPATDWTDVHRVLEVAESELKFGYFEFRGGTDSVFTIGCHNITKAEVELFFPTFMAAYDALPKHNGVDGINDGEKEE